MVKPGNNYLKNSGNPADKNLTQELFPSMNKVPDNSHDTSFRAGNLVELLRWRADTQPDKRAYTYLKDGENKEIQLTYGELDKRARAIAASLEKKGLTGERALLLYPPGLDYISGFFGCLYAGVIAVPAYPPDPNRLNRSLPRLQAIVNDAKATIALTNDSIYYMIKMLKLGSKFTSTFDKLPVFRKFRTSMKYFSTSKGAIVRSRELGDLDWISTDSIASGLADEWQNPPIDSETIAFLQYTSGSTGTPKGVILTHENLLHNSEIIKNSTAFSDHAEGVFWLPIYHDMGLIGGVLQPLYREVPSTLMSPLAFLQRPLRWLEVISRLNDREVGSAAPNFAYELCIKKATPEKVKQLSLSHWTYALSGAEPVRHQTIERFAEIFKPAGFKKSAFYPAYGLAEATLLVTASDFNKPPVYIALNKELLKKNKIQEVSADAPEAQIIVSCGKNQPTQETIIVDPEKRTRCSENQIGEVWVKGKSVSRGYYGREEETRETFQNYLADTGKGPYLRTGDLGFIRNDELFITGRVKDLIIIRGTNHYPQDIELTVEQCHPEIRPGCTAAFTVDVNDQEQLVVVLEIRHSRNVDFEAIIQSVRQAVSANHDLQVYSVVLIKARTINKTSSGKIQRRATRQDYLENKLSVLAKWESSTDTLPVVSISEEDDFIVKTDELESTVRLVTTKDKLALQIEEWLIAHLADTLKTSKKSIDIRQPFISFGLDSAQAVGLAGDLEEWLERELPPTLIWDYPTIEALARHLASEEVEIIPALKTKIKKETDYEPIAVIGLGAKFPGANNYLEFWNMLREGLDGISEVPPDRWNAEAFYDSEESVAGKMITKNGCFVDNVDLFDAHFFGISPREAAQIDPQQRLLLEVCWHALEHGGQTTENLRGSRTGVFVGISSNDYVRLQKGGYESINPYSGTGNAFSIAANRISYFFDFRGPSMAIDTACSSSLVAIHNACQSLRNGDCDMALAGGVNLILSPELSITFSQARMLSRDGKCKTFDAEADGYGRGEGVGMVVLKRLSDALENNDRILAVIKGSAVNQDGRTNGITAPNGLAQQAVIKEALDRADVAPDEINYLETHGTGTPLGDPIEIESIKRTMLAERNKENPLWIGSVKTNIGHLEAAAGIAGFIKIVLALMHEELPPHLHFKQWNPHIKTGDAPIRVCTSNLPWKRGEKKRLAAVSAFGFGGTNAHVIVEEPPLQEYPENETLTPSWHILTLSAQNEKALQTLAADYAAFIEGHIQSIQKDLYDFLYSANLKRTRHDVRLALIGQNAEEFKEQLLSFSNDPSPQQFIFDQIDVNTHHRIAFIYSGQGPQWWAMGRDLLEHEPIFRATIERISFLLEEYTGWSLIEELKKDEQTSRLNETEVAQPAIFAIQVALTALWRTWGITPEAVTGHSVGEVAAAHAAGILSLENAVKVIYHRSRLMQKATGLGKMAAVDLPVEQLQEIIADYTRDLSIAAINSISSTVLSGNENAIDQVLKKLSGKDIFYKKLPVNYAFHSPQMEPFREELKEALTDIRLNAMQIPIISTVTGQLAGNTDYDGSYWSRNIRECVQFSAAIDQLIADQCTIFIEIGPHPVLANYIHHNLQAADQKAVVLPTLQRGEPDRAQILQTLGRLFVAGYPIDWKKIYSQPGKLLDLPLYPFQRERYWIEDKKDEITPAGELSKGDRHPLLGEQQSNALFPLNSSWNVVIKSDYVAYLNQVRNGKPAVLPEATYLEMAVAASRQTFGEESAILTNIVFKNALRLRKNESLQLHFTLTPISATKANFQALSKHRTAKNEVKWVLHSLGSILKTGHEPQHRNPFSSLQELKATLQQKPSVYDFLAVHGSMGIGNHSLFESAEEIWTSAGEALLKLNLSRTKINDWRVYHMHPLVLDTCFRFMTATIISAYELTSFLIPHSLEYLKLHGPLTQELWVYVKIDDFSEQRRDINCQMHIFSDKGKIILDMHGLRLKVFPAELSVPDFIYEIEWREIDFNKIRRSATETGQEWLILSEHSNQSENLAKQLRQRGKRCLKASLSDHNTALAHDEITLNPGDKEGCSRYLNRVITHEGQVICLWNLENNPALFESFSTLLEILEQLDQKPQHLWFFTHGLLTVGPEDALATPEKIEYLERIEDLIYHHPGIRFHHVDLGAEPFQVFNLLHLPVNEYQVAIRRGRIYVPRMIHSEEPEPRDLPPVWNVEVPLEECHQEPKAGMVEIELVHCSLSNREFRMAGNQDFTHPQELGLGCSGMISAVHDGCTRFKVGDEVIALAQGDFRKYILVDEHLVQHKPAALSLEEAATIPANFFTAIYALEYLARIRKGESIVILDACSDDGLAALQIAQTYECKIYATVDQSEKQNFLRQKGFEHVFLNNGLAHVDEIMELTDMQGVDIVFNASNSISDATGFSLLKEFGRYVDLNTESSFEQPIVYKHLRRNISYFSIDIDEVLNKQSALAGELFEQVIADFNNNRYSPFNRYVFPRQALGIALQQFREHRHIGKYLLDFKSQLRDKEKPYPALDSQKNYCIAGIFDQNELGLLDWAIEQGAQNIYIFSLSDFLPENELRMRNHEAVQVQIIQPDQLHAPLWIQGVILSVGAITNERIREIRDRLTQLFRYLESQDLDFFISCTVFDLFPVREVNPDRVHLEHTIKALSQELIRRGKPALQLRLAGFIPESSQQAKNRWKILNYFISKASGDYIITDTDWSVLAENFNPEEIPALYSDLIIRSSESVTERSDATGHFISREDLLSEKPEERLRILRTYIQSELSRILKIPAEKINSEQSLLNLGIDSLMAIELKNTLEGMLGVNVPVAVLLQGPSIDRLCAEILPQIDGTASRQKSAVSIEHKTDEVQEFELSQGQKAMYFQHVMAPQSIFNLAYAVRIRSDFDVRKLKQAFQVLVDRHPALRTTFHLRDGKPIQRVHPHMQSALHEKDVNGWTDEAIREQINAEILKPFDLSNGPLMKVILYERSKSDRILLFVMHHIITDIWSQALLLNELSLIFDDPENTSRLTKLTHDYRDYIEWQEQLLAGQEGQKLLSYWTNKLKSDLPNLNFPTDAMRPAVQTYRGSTETFWFGEELSGRIKSFCEEHGVTLFTTLLAAYYVLLHRYTGQPDIIVGSPTAGRNQKEFANIIGYFVNPLPFRVTLEGNPAFTDFLRQVKDTALEVFEHMDYPLTLLVEKLHPRRDPSRTPLFQTMFILQRAHLMHDQGLSQFALSREGASLKLGNLTIESMNLEQGVAPFDLTMMAVESGNGLAASLGYNVDLFQQRTIQKLLDHYCNLLKQIVSSPEIRIGDLQVLSDDDKNLIIGRWNQTSRENPRDECVHQLFEKQVEHNPNKTAVVFEDKLLTYDELNRKANQLARFLLAKGLKTEEVVGICLDRSLEMVVAMLGVIKAGGAYIPIDPSYPRERIRYILNDSHLSILLTQGNLTSHLSDQPAQVYYLDNGRETIWNQDDTNLTCHSCADNLVYVIYTSGSTGKPKGTMLHHRGLINVLLSTTQHYHVQSDSQVMQFASFSFDASVEEIFSALINGATIHLVKRETLLSLSDLIAFIREHKITNVTFPPSVLNVLQPDDFPTLKTVISAGEKCLPAIANRWFRHTHFINGYGPTEATICTATYEVDHEIEGNAVPIGKPISNARVYILDEYMQPTPVGVPGELYIAGAGLARGYLGRPELTAERFIPDPFSTKGGERLYRTGDLARYLPDGTLEFIDRIDEQVKIRGHRIELGEIESVITLYEGVKLAAVIARDYGSADKKIIAYAVPEDHQQFDLNDLQKFLRLHLPDFMMPSSIVILDEIPLTSNGKVDRQALPDPELKTGSEALVPPANDFERQLSNIWQEILNIKQVGVNESFFDLGGHSLSVIQVQGKIKEIFDKEINVVDLFKYPTIRLLAQYLEDRSDNLDTIKKSQQRADRQKEATRIQQQRLRSRRK